jgi:hypothetical protein
MKRILLLFILCSFFCSSCKKKENIPDHIIQPALYTEILRDILLAEANHKLALRNGNRWENMLDSSYYHIYEFYHVTPEMVDSSMHFYIKHPNTYTEITENVLDELHKMEQAQSLEKTNNVP